MNNPQKHINNAIGNLNGLEKYFDPDKSSARMEPTPELRVAAAQAQAQIATAMALSGIGLQLADISTTLQKINERMLRIQ